MVSGRDALMFSGAAVVTAGVLFAVVRYGPSAVVAGTSGAVRDAGRQVGSVNKGTPYEGGGVVGTLGNATNRALGGVPESVGSWIGHRVADLRGF